MITLDDSLERLNRNLAEYAKHTSKSIQDAVAKQGSKLAFELSARLQAEKPGKGSIRAERLAALQSGGGVKVRDSIRQKVTSGKRRGKLNLQARRVRAELNLRERGRGFLAYGARINTRPFLSARAQRLQHWSRHRQLLATAGLIFNPDTAKIEISYGGPQTELGDTFQNPRFRKHINAALGAVADDIQIYLDQKLEEANR